jgi:hypothetical protein
MLESADRKTKADDTTSADDQKNTQNATPGATKTRYTVDQDITDTHEDEDRHKPTHDLTTHFGKDKVTPVNHVLLGNISGECPSTAKIVRIFTSSTFTGT